MRNKISTFLLVAAIAATQTLPVMAETLYYDGKAHEYNLDKISLYVNGKEIETTMPPVQLEGRVLVPSREVFEPMGAQVDWDEKLNQVKVTYKSDLMILYVDKKTVSLNGKDIPIDVPPKIINDKLMIPVRFISENLGFRVDWNSTGKSVWIYETVAPTPVPTPTPTPTPTPDIDNGNNGNGGSAGTVENQYVGNKNPHKIDISEESYNQTSVTNVNVSGDKTTISSTTPISDVDILLHAGKVIIDIGNSKSQLSSTITPSNNNYIKSIRTSQFLPTTTRVVLDLKAGALVNASLNQDRTQLYIDLQPRVIEKLTYDTDGNKDIIFIDGISKDQIEIISKDQTIQLTMPKAILEKNISWSNLKGNFIEKIVASNDGGDVKVNINLKSNYSYNMTNDHIGTTLTIEKKNEDAVQPPTVQPPTEEKLDNLTYIGGSKPQIELLSALGVNSKSIVVNDDYRNRTLTFDLLKDCSNLLQNQTININDGKIKEINIVNDKTTKLVVKTETVMTYNLSSTNKGVTIQIVKPQEKYDKILVIDAGHGGTDSGAVGNGTNEKTLNYNQSMELYKSLSQKSDIKIYMTRETDVYPTLAFRTTLANEIEADLFVSVHNNAATSAARGAETLYFPSTTDTRGQRVAQIIQNALVNKCGMLNRGIKPRSDLYVLKNTSMPAVLIETGFISNALDAAILKDAAFTRKWADAISDSIIEAFKIL